MNRLSGYRISRALTSTGQDPDEFSPEVSGDKQCSLIALDLLWQISDWATATIGGNGYDL
jgi:hypothetical protein